MEGLYLIHTREFISTDKPIYKIGRGGNLYNRINLFYLIAHCDDGPRQGKQDIGRIFGKHSSDVFHEEESGS